MEEFDDLGGLPRARLAGDGDRPTPTATDARLDHDAARGQGPGVRHRVPARLGGGPVPPPARARRERPRRPRGGAPPGLCRADAGAPPGARSPSPPTAASTACGPRPSPRASSTNCRRTHVEVEESKGKPGWRRRLVSRFDRVDAVRLVQLRHARLAARQGGRGGGGGFAEAAGALERGRFGGSGRGAFGHARRRQGDRGRAVAKSTGAAQASRGASGCSTSSSATATITAVDGNKLTVAVRQGRREEGAGQFRPEGLRRAAAVPGEHCGRDAREGDPSSRKAEALRVVRQHPCRQDERHA